MDISATFCEFVHRQAERFEVRPAAQHRRGHVHAYCFLSHVGKGNQHAADATAKIKNALRRKRGVDASSAGRCLSAPRRASP